MGNVLKKLAICLVVGGVFIAVTRALEFPFVYQMLFLGFAMLGAIVFMLLDAPPLRTMSGAKSVVVLVAFYILLCTVCIAGASFFPQFDPEEEKGKIGVVLGTGGAGMSSRRTRP